MSVNHRLPDQAPSAAVIDAVNIQLVDNRTVCMGQVEITQALILVHNGPSGTETVQHIRTCCNRAATCSARSYPLMPTAR